MLRLFRFGKGISEELALWHDLLAIYLLVLKAHVFAVQERLFLVLSVFVMCAFHELLGEAIALFQFLWEIVLRRFI